MSKVKKVYCKKVLDSKLVSHFPSQSLINPNSSFNNMPKVPLDRPENHSESPFTKKISNSRSNSNLKDPSLQQPSGLVSPPLNPKFSLNSKYKINFSNTFYSKAKEINEIKNPTLKPQIEKKKSIHNEFFIVQSKLDEISQRHKENGINSEIFENYKECFDEIISKDKTVGPLLLKIKNGYEDWIKSKIEIMSQNNKLKNDVTLFSKKLAEELEENKRLHRKIQKFAGENVELGRTLEERDTNFRTLQEYLLKITNISIEDVPQDVTSWKVLVSENKSYSELCEKLKKKVKTMKIHEKSLMKSYLALKQKLAMYEQHAEKGSKERKAKRNVSMQLESSDVDCLQTEPSKGSFNLSKRTISKLNCNTLSDDNISSNDELNL